MKPTHTLPTVPATRHRRPAARPLCIAVLTPLLLSACTTWQAPAAWEKDVLARPAMRMDDAPLAARFGRHVYTSKESPSGGDGIGGGGCGCN